MNVVELLECTIEAHLTVKDAINNCERCNKEFQLYKLDYDVCWTNNKTGWIFPMKLNGGKTDV